VIALIPIYFAGMLNWVYDAMAFKPDLLPDNFNPDKTWKNKWDYEGSVEIINRLSHLGRPRFNHHWYLGLHWTPYRERFPYSSTLLVFTTDWFHAIQMLQRVMWVTGFAISAFYPPVILLSWGLGKVAIFLIYIKVSALVYGAGFHTSRILNGWRLKRKV